MAHQFIALFFTELKITVELQSHYTEVLLITTTVILWILMPKLPSSKGHHCGWWAHIHLKTS